MKRKRIGVLLPLIFVAFPLVAGIYVDVYNVFKCKISPFRTFSFLFPLFYLLGFVIGYSTYGMLYGSGGLREEEKVEVVVNTAMKFLRSTEEKRVLEEIVKRKRITQSELARILNMDRVKIHRIVRKLRDYGLISVRREGKVNVIEFKGL